MDPATFNEVSAFMAAEGLMAIFHASGATRAGARQRLLAHAHPRQIHALGVWFDIRWPEASE